MRIGENILWAAAEQVFRIGVVFFINIGIARTLGPEGYGMLSTVFAYAALLSGFAMFGLDTVAIREIAVSSPPQLSRVAINTLAIRWSATLIIAAGTGVWLLNKEWDAFSHGLLLLVLLIPFQAIGTTMGNVFSGKLLTKYSTIALIAGLSLASVLRVYGIISKQDVPYFIYCHLAEYVIATLIVIFLFSRSFGAQLQFASPSKQGILLLIQGSKWLLISSIVVQLLQNAGLFFLAKLGTSTDLGNYAAALRLIGVTQFLPSLIGQSFIPTINQLYEQGSPSLELFENQLFRCLALCGYMITIGCVLVGPWILPLLLGKEFETAVPIFIMLSFGAIPLSMAAARAAIFSKRRNYSSILVSDISGALLVGIFSILLISPFGSRGVAMASVIGFLVSYLIIPYFLMDKDRDTRSRMFRSFLFPFPDLSVLFSRR